MSQKFPTHIEILIKRDGGLCHYCNGKVQPKNGVVRKNTATKEHIFPKYLGGPNELENYVLAHQSCNNQRGTNMFYCKCRTCQEAIMYSLYDGETLGKAFDSIISFNKIWIRKKGTKWVASVGHNGKRFDSYSEAIDFITENPDALRGGLRRKGLE